METGLSGKVALITGGSQGIGKKISLALAHEGVNVGICARDKKNLATAAKDITDTSNVDVAAVQADCMNAEQIKVMVASVTEQLGNIDILINCVGRAKAGPFLELTDEDWFDTIHLKLMAAVRVTREVLPQMVHAQSGRIIMIGGVFGIQPNPFSIPMGVVNAGLFNFTKGLAQDVACHNILVNAVAPGRVDTPLFQKLVASQAQRLSCDPNDAMTQILSEVPIGRAADPAEIASVVVFLASNLASYITGEIITVDGCWTKCV